MIIQLYKMPVNPFFPAFGGISEHKKIFYCTYSGLNLTMLICEEQISTIC